MPYKSAAQARLFHYLESKGEMPKKTVAKYDRMTEFEDLPERVKAAMGGIMGEIAEMDLDETTDTSGEPNDEVKHYAHGGKVKPGLYANIHAKRERIERGSGERMRKPGSEGAPTASAFKEAEKTANMAEGGMVQPNKMFAEHLKKKMRGY